MSEWIRSFFSLSVITLSYQVPGRRSCAEKPTPRRLSGPLAKYSTLPKFEFDVQTTHPARDKGRIAIVTNRGWAAMDATASGITGIARVHFYRPRICECQPAPGRPCAL